MNDILIIDDEEDIRNLVRAILEDEYYKTRVAANSSKAYQEVETTVPSLIILDIWLEGSQHDGLEILSQLKKDHPDLPVIMISGHGTIETAVSAIKLGAYDFIEKPFTADRLLLMIKRALETATLRQENKTLKASRQLRPVSLHGSTQAILQLQSTIKRVAPTNSRVFLIGEDGSGKNTVARMIHQLSERSDKAFHVLNCTALEPDLLEERLFGSSEKGVLEQANGGTLFLDGVAEMPFETQGKLIRVLHENRFKKPGHDDYTPVDIRIISGSNHALDDDVEQGRFRKDLYYRLNVIPLNIPSLYERAQDIPLLIEHFLRELSESEESSVPMLSSEAMHAMKSYHWPGNVRQLKNVVEWLLIMTRDKSQKIEMKNLPSQISGQDRSEHNGGMTISADASFIDMGLREAREVFERSYLQVQIQRFNGNISKTSKFIGMERSALHRKLKALKLDEDPSKEAKIKQEGNL